MTKYTYLIIAIALGVVIYIISSTYLTEENAFYRDVQKFQSSLLQKAICDYIIAKQRLPDSLYELEAEKQNNVNTKDVWGNKLVYLTYKPYIIIASLGKDNAQGGLKMDKDMVIAFIDSEKCPYPPLSDNE